MIRIAYSLRIILGVKHVSLVGFLHNRLLSDYKIAASTILTFEKEAFNKLSGSLKLKRFSNQVIKDCDFNVLLLKRPSNSSAFSNCVVFPGGVLTESDLYADGWSHLIYTNINKELRTLNEAPIYREIKERFKYGSEKFLNPSVALRLCALRELFEETGLLLADDSIDGDTKNVTAYILHSTELTSWKSELLTNPWKFSNLYSSLGLTPPIAALKEWSNWITPPGMKFIFDTIFYFVQINSIKFKFITYFESQQIKYCESEVHTMYMDTPSSFLYPNSLKNTDKSQKFAPPQTYELGRLCHFTNILKLSAFASQRAKFGSNRWCPLPVETDVNSELVKFYILPGDERYDDIHRLLQKSLKPKFSHDELKLDKMRNRFLFSFDLKEYWFDSNVYELGHVTPITKSEYYTKFIS